jgi:hypothetical protein
VLDPDFVDYAGKRALVVQAIYDLKSDGVVFRDHVAECMNHLGWKRCYADRDLWMKAETHPDDGMLYWAYILI